MKWKIALLVILATTTLVFFSSSVNFNPVIYDRSIHQERYSLKDKFVPLPQSVINQVKYFVFFVGRAHSGHSIVGSILDSHPHMIVAHEAKLFVQLKENPTRFTSKAAVFNELWSKSYNDSHCDGRLRTNNSLDIKNKGYTLQIDGLHQGTYISTIDVIGDKNGGNTVSLFHKYPSEWEKIFYKLKSLVNIPFKVIFVIRNPYDNIASALLYNSVKRMSAIRNSNKTFAVSGIIHQTERYFAAHQTVMDIKKQYELDLLEVHVQDLVEHPNATITKMCDFLGVQCSDSYIKGCSKKLFNTESKMRHRIKWTADSISQVRNYILKYDNLLRYSFDS